MTKPRSWPEQHRSNKLTLAQILAIKLDTRKNHLIAAEHGVSRSYVSQIKSGSRMKTAYGAMQVAIGVERRRAQEMLL